MISKLKTNISHNYTNALGWKTNRKIMVIESDDWGSIRMPNKKTYQNLKQTRLASSLSLYDSLDSLEHREDFNFMLNVADSIKDCENNPLVFTLNTVMQNPNFKKIKESGYNQFFGTCFFESYKDYYSEDVEDLWRLGIKDGLIRPQFHAREHLNSYLWLKDLRKGNQDTKVAFDYHFFGVKTTTSSKLRNHYLATYFSETREEFEDVSLNTELGLKMFKNVFGYDSKTFIASNYCWSKELEKNLIENGVEGIQAQAGNINPDFQTGKKKIRRVFTGKSNKYGQKFTVRNVSFEPFSNPNKDWVDQALKEVENAFFWKKPAIVCMHRVNFSSEMKIKNRDQNLFLLKEFIKKALKKYPSIEFVSSDQLIKIMIE